MGMGGHEPAFYTPTFYNLGISPTEISRFPPHSTSVGGCSPFSPGECPALVTMLQCRWTEASAKEVGEGGEGTANALLNRGADPPEISRFALTVAIGRRRSNVDNFRNLTGNTSVMEKKNYNTFYQNQNYIHMTVLSLSNN